MSIKNRIKDAQILYANGQEEGALLSVLIAVAATSRKRYPRDKMSDKDAFIKFVGEEMKTITGCVQNFNIKFRNKVMPLQNLLYKFIRCELAHEAQLPEDIIFEPGNSLKVSVTDNCITFSDGLIDGLCRAVCNATENKDELTQSQEETSQ